MKLTIDGIDYIHGATHAGLDCWLKAALVPAMEVSYYLGQPIGDWCKDQLIRYLAGPDEYRNEDVVITDANDTRKRWPLKNMHRDTYTTKKTDKLPERAAGDEWPKYIANKSSMAIIHSAGKVTTHYANGKITHGYAGAVRAWLYAVAHQERGCKPITPTEAAQWLRANGHAAEADKIEPRHPSAGQAGASGVRVWRDRAMNRVSIGSECYTRYTCGWEHNSMSAAVMCTGATEITNTPEAAAIVNDLCEWVPSAAAIINAKG